MKLFALVNLLFIYQIGYSNELSHADRLCLASNVFFEAGGESKQGKLIVAYVTMERMRSSKYPNSICGVVSHNMERIGCGFSWLCDDKQNRVINYKGKDWIDTLRIIRFVEKHPDFFIPGFEGATMYHRSDIKPTTWDYSKLKLLGQIGNHTIYQEL